EALRTVRLQHLLLMLLRMAAVVLIALAAARPVVPGGVGARHEPMALVIVFDHSLSSGAVKGGTRVVDDLAARARETLREAQAADAVWLIGADGLARRGSARELTLVVSAVRPDARRLDLGAAVRQAARLIATSGYARGEIHVLSDMQRTAFDFQLSTFDSLLRGVPVLVYHPAGDPPPNSGVALAQPTPSLWLPGAGAVLARVVSGPTNAAGRVTLSVTVDGRSGARALALAGGEVNLAVPAVPPLAPGWHVGAVTLEPDELRADDERPFAVRVAPPAVVSTSGDLGAFVTEALGVLAANGRIRLTGAPDVRLSTSLASGAVVLIPPDDPAAIGALNRALAARGVPWRLGARKEAEDSIAAREIGEVAGARVFFRYPIEPLPGAQQSDVLARAGGDAWLVRVGRVVIVGSRLMPEESTLPLGGGFVPFVSALVNRIARGESGVITAAPGENVIVPPGVTALATRDSVLPARPGEVLAAPVVPGAYALRAGADTVGVLVVAADPRESDLTRATDAEARAAWRGARVEVTASSREYAARRFRGAGRSELTGWLLAAAMLVLLAEGVMAAGGRLRRPSQA
ncbi:MAG: hypothetical protein ACHQX4_06265, partial [Gemmatimonadales bacterium]